MFSQESKLAVLESKLNIYEELSREMLSKLESAVDKISEGNSRIATILAKHDERIDQNLKADNLIIKSIDEIKITEEKNSRILHDRIDTIQIKIDSLSKFRWQFGGVLAVVVVLIGSINAFVPMLLTQQSPKVIMERR